MDEKPKNHQATVILNEKHVIPWYEWMKMNSPERQHLWKGVSNRLNFSVCFWARKKKSLTVIFWRRPKGTWCAQTSVNKQVLTQYSGEGNGTHSSTLAWKIPRTEEPGGLWSTGSLRVWHDWLCHFSLFTPFSLFTFMHWRRKWQPTPVFLPGESQGQGSPVGCHLWGFIELDTTEVT